MAGSAQVIDGSKLAAQIRKDAAARVRGLRDQGVSVQLDTILVGEPHAGLLYARAQENRCRKVGIECRLHTLDEKISDAELRAYISRLSDDPQVSGIMLNLPLPGHLDTPAAQYAIDPYKDVEGVNPANIGLLFYGTPIIAPCTALAVMHILRTAGVEIRGKAAAVVGQGSIVGRPITLALIGEEATVVTCNKYTADLAERTRSADILIAAAGVPELIRAEHVKPGAVVIDVGINTIGGQNGEEARVVGDVKFDEVSERASVITPVPGGVGPVTVAVLLYSTSEAAAKQLASRRID